VEAHEDCQGDDEGDEKGDAVLVGMERVKGLIKEVVRDGEFKIAFIVRFGCYDTIVFSTCGIGIFALSLWAVLLMPKQFITVYLWCYY